jgi:hypothetical protein
MEKGEGKEEEKERQGGSIQGVNWVQCFDLIHKHVEYTAQQAYDRTKMGQRQDRTKRKTR